MASLSVVSNDLERAKKDIDEIKVNYVSRTELRSTIDKIDFMYRVFWIMLSALVLGVVGLFFNLVGR